MSAAGMTARKMMAPEASGGPSFSSACRTVEWMPSAPISAAASIVSPDCSDDSHAGAVLLETGNACMGTQRHEVMRPAGLEQGSMHVGAMGDRVGIAEAFAKARAALDIDDFVAGHGVVHHQRSISSARRLTGSPTPSASSADSALGAT